MPDILSLENALHPAAFKVLAVGMIGGPLGPDFGQIDAHIPSLALDRP